MRGSRRSLLVLILAAGSTLAGSPARVTGQEAGVGPLQQVELTLGGILYGRVAGSGDPVQLVVANGDTIRIPASSIARMSDADGVIVNEQYIGRDPNETRLFFGPTGRTIPAGDGYFGVFELSMPFLAYGLTDRVTIAGGTPLLIAFGMPPVVYLAPKVQLLRADGLTGSVGSLSFMGEEIGNAGVVYAVTTLDMDGGMSSITAGAGWGYASDDVTDRPVIMLGGDARMTRSIKLLTENYFVPGVDFSLFTGGIRFIGDRLSADVGLAFMSGSDMALPLVNFVWGF